MSINRKETRNKEVKAMEDECRFLLDSSDKEIQDICAEIYMIHRVNLRSIRYTGTPENIKEIEGLVSSWDYSEVTCNRINSDATASFSRINCDPSTFSPFDYIKINDYVREWYASEASKKKVLLLVIHTDDQGETL